MNFSKEKVDRVKEQFPIGTRIHLNYMCNDEPGMKEGLRGTVVGVDAQPALLMDWDNGSHLSLFPEEDSFRRLMPSEIEAEQAAVVAEQDLGPKLA